MPRRKVQFRAGCCYHVYNRGHNCDRIFFERENYIHFLRLMRQYLAGETLDLLAYCLMPNHYHFLVYLKADTLSATMHSLTMAYSKAINHRYERVGTLFQGRFQAIAVEDPSYLLNLSRYIHLNPVKAQLVEKPEEWEFSSYPEYVSLRQGTLPNQKQLYALVGSKQSYSLEGLDNNFNELLLKGLFLDE